MDRIKRLSYEVLDKHQSKFGEDFADNKKILDQISIIRSKGLKNEVAGYITKFIKKQIREEKAKHAQKASNQTESVSEIDLTQKDDSESPDEPSNEIVLENNDSSNETEEPITETQITNESASTEEKSE